MEITLVGHSTVVLASEGTKLLLDPFFSLWGNPAYRRSRPPAGEREEFLDVQAVLLSHAHFDHFDRRFLRMLPRTTPVYGPRLTSSWLQLKAGRKVASVVTWRPFDVGKLRITPVPALHLGPTVGYVVQGGETSVYFAGDTYFRPFMHRIATELRPQIALLPLLTFRIPLLMGVGGFLRAVETLRPQVVVPIHLGVEPRAPLLRTTGALDRVRAGLRKRGLAAELVELREGERWQAS